MTDGVSGTLAARHPAPGEPSPWIRRWVHLVRPGGAVLDVACGSGRHLRWLAAQGLRMTGVDRDTLAIEPLKALAEIVVADIESGPWPFAGRRFDAIVVTNYLWRPLLGELLDSLADGGVLLFETFAAGNETVGRPSRADFLLRHGELLEVARGLRIVGYEDGFLAGPDRFVQRIAAVRETASRSTEPPRYALDKPQAR